MGKGESTYPRVRNHRDAVAELTRLIGDSRPGTASSDQNAMAEEIPVPYWVADGVLKRVAAS
jgi:hypothetical protein